jgi:hypothetical protein
MQLYLLTNGVNRNGEKREKKNGGDRRTRERVRRSSWSETFVRRVRSGQVRSCRFLCRAFGRTVWP